MIELEPTARAKRLRKALPALLHDLEATGQQAISGTGRRWPRNQHAAELGISNAEQNRTDVPGSIYCIIAFDADRTGGVVDPSGAAAVAWASAYLAADAQGDVRSKLEASGADERHAFIILPPLADAPFSATDLLMREAAPPPEPPVQLPPEITHLWLIGGWSAGEGFHYSTDDGWGKFAKV